ncbi:MAG: thioredoxin [Alphaproteobacteria bacterium]|nr:thioredoxin [Alphaproteobacteria bacterium]
MAGHVTTDATFADDIKNSDKPVLLDFWAEWCGPCRMLLPVVEELATEMSDSLTVMKMNVDENPATPAKYGVRGIPTLLLFQNGELKKTRVGGLPKADLRKWIEDSLAA